MTTIGERFISQFETHLGLVERPPGSNDDGGGTITRWQTEVGLVRLPASQKPWCGTAEEGVARECGGVVWDAYARILSPSTNAIAGSARALGWVWDGRGQVPTGALWVNPGVHTGAVRTWLGSGLVATIEGNHFDGVRHETRSVYGYVIVVPPRITDLLGPPPPVVREAWFLEDPRAARAKRVVMASYSTAKARDGVLAKWTQDPARAKFHPRPRDVVEKGKRKFEIIGGPIHVYGSFPSLDRAKFAEEHLSPRLRRWYGLDPTAVVLRRYRKSIPV